MVDKENTLDFASCCAIASGSRVDHFSEHLSVKFNVIILLTKGFCEPMD